MEWRDILSERRRTQPGVAAHSGHGITIKQADGGRIEVGGDRRTRALRLPPGVELGGELSEVKDGSW